MQNILGQCSTFRVRNNWNAILSEPRLKQIKIDDGFHLCCQGARGYEELLEDCLKQMRAELMDQ